MNIKDKIIEFMREEAYKPLTFKELMNVLNPEGNLKKN